MDKAPPGYGRPVAGRFRDGSFVVKTPVVPVEDCLPPDLRGPATTVTRIAAGLSGAGVYRVEAGGQAFVLKVAGDAEDAGDWRRTLQVQRLAAAAGLAPRLVHVDEGRRAVVTAFVT